MNFFDEDLADRVPSSFPEDPPDEEMCTGFPLGLPATATELEARVRAGADAETFADLLDSVAEMDRLLATVAAWRAELIDEARRWNESTPHRGTEGAGGWNSRMVARRTLVTELACALRIPERTAESLIEDSRALQHSLPATRQALREGSISYRHSQRLIDHATSLPAEKRAAFEASVLPFAQKLTVAKFDARARTMREQTDPDTITARHVTATGNREVQLQPTRDGMAWLSALLPAATALACYDRITGIATSLQGPMEERTLPRLRADVFADLLIDGVTRGTDHSAADRGIRAKVLVTVPVLTLLGHGDAPGSLEGYGPIDADTARRLAAHAPSFTRILTHPETGAVLSVGRDSYAVPADMRIWLRVRDGTCRYPGCTRPAGRCDLDHTCDWQYDGDTAHDNLAHLCAGHHGVKHHTDWTVAHVQKGNGATDGTLEWTAPSGKKYTTEPDTILKPDPPPF